MITDCFDRTRLMDVPSKRPFFLYLFRTIIKFRPAQGDFQGCWRRNCSRNRKILDEPELSLPNFPNSHEFGYSKWTLSGRTEASSPHIPAPLATLTS